MKLLFVTYYLGKPHSVATTNIVFRICRELSACGVECHAIGPHQKQDELIEEPLVTLHPFFLERSDNPLAEAVLALHGTRFAFFKKAALALRHPRLAFRLLRGQAPSMHALSLQEGYQHAVSDLLKKEHFDAVIGVYFPVDVMKAFTNIQTSTPLFLYQMDPWALHETEYPESGEIRQEQELKAFAHVRHIFTTHPLYEQYKLQPFAPYHSKMTPLEFPNLEPCEEKQEEGVFPFLREGAPENELRFVYTGFINDEFRSPAFFLQAFECYFEKNPNAHLYFIGGLESDVLSEFAKNHPTIITLLPKQSAKTARLCLQTADFLINIGNRFTNQVPSKLMDYMSTGRPIVSTCKLQACPSLPYLNEYMLNLTLFESESPEVAAQKLESFVLQNHGKTVAFETIQAQFESSTPCYVARQIQEVCEKETRS